METILNNLGFTNRALSNVQTFSAGTYNFTLYAEFAGWHAENELSYYQVGTSVYNVIFTGPEGNSGYVTPPITKTFAINYQFGISFLSPGPRRYFTEYSKNGDGVDHCKIYENLDAPGMFLIGFENTWGGGDKDFNDMVFALKPCPNQAPVASFTYSPANPLIYDIVTFNASASYDPDGSIVSYTWDFGDGNVTTVTNPIITHVYTTATSTVNYTVTLTVTDNEGATGLTTQIVPVTNPAILYVSLPAGTYVGPDPDNWLSQCWLLNNTGLSGTFTVRINNTACGITSYDTHLIIALNNASYQYLDSLTVNTTTIPKTSFTYGTPKPYNYTLEWEEDVYPTWFSDTYVVGNISSNSYKDMTVLVSFSNATGVRMHFDAYGSADYPPPPPPPAGKHVTHNPHQKDSTVLFQPPVNTPPMLNPIGNKTVNEMTTLSFTATATDPEVPPQTLTFSLGPGAPSGASITNGGAFTWTPTEAQGPGSYVIRIIVSDGIAQDYEDITVTVYEVNQPPVLDPIGNKSVNEGTTLSFTATATDADIPTQTLTFSLGAGAPSSASITSGGVFSWTPTENQGPGVYNINVTVSDGVAIDYEVIAVTVYETNVAPMLDPIGDKTVNELSTLSFTATASDPDVPPQTLTFSLGSGAPSGASITGAGVFTWTPTEAQGAGVYNINVTVSDGIAIDYEVITVTVNEVNTPPVLDPIGNKTVNEGTTLSFTATASDADTPAQTLTFSLGSGAPSGASITSGGAFSWAPTEAQGPGSYIIRIIVSDGFDQDYEDITVTVNEVNVAPVLDPIGPKSVNELSILSFTATASDADLPAQTLTFSLGAGAPSGASITSSGTFTWTPTESQGPAVYNINITVSDGVAIDYEIIEVTVTEGNQPPVLNSIGNKTVNELSTLSFTATASDPDMPPQTLTFSLGPGAPSGASITSGGAFSWAPTEVQGPGSYVIRIIVSDSIDQDYEDITVTVNEVNQPPVLSPIGPKTVSEGVLLQFTVTASDSDLPAQTLIYSASNLPPGATFNPSTHAFSWTPTSGQAGVYSVHFEVSDGYLKDSEDITITVTAPSPPAVGGYALPINLDPATSGSLIPQVGFASVLSATVAATIILVRRRKKTLKREH